MSSKQRDEKELRKPWGAKATARESEEEDDGRWKEMVKVELSGIALDASRAVWARRARSRPRCSGLISAEKSHK